MTDSGQSASEGLLTHALQMASQGQFQRREPRNPRSAFGVEEVREIGQFLRHEKPPSPEKNELREDWSSKKSSGPSRQGSRHNNPTLEFFKTGRFPSKHFKNLLRSRSVSPPPDRKLHNVENTYVVEKISLVRQNVPGGDRQYTRILRDSSRTDGFDKLSTYRVNYMLDDPKTGAVQDPNSKEAVIKDVNEVKDQSRMDSTPGTTIPCHAITIDRQEAKADQKPANEVSRKVSLNQTQDASQNPACLPRQATAPQIRDFAEEGPRFPDPELMATIQRRKRRSKKRDDLGEITRFGFVGNEVTTAPSPADRNVPCTPDGEKTAQHIEQAYQKHIQAVVRTPSGVSSEAQSSDWQSAGRPSKESMSQSTSISDNADAATDITIPSSAGTPRESRNIRRTASPKPAPTGPLPPLPEGADAIKKSNSMIPYSKSLRERQSKTNSSFNVIPPKSPARHRHPPCTIPNIGSNQRARSKLGSDMNWPYPPSSPHASQTVIDSQLCPGIQESSPEDPFFSRVQKTTDLKRRDMQQSNSTGNNDCATEIAKNEAFQQENDENIIQLPSAKQLQAEHAADAETEVLLEAAELNTKSKLENEKPLLGYSPIQTIFENEPVEQVLPVRSKSLTVRTTYRSHSTQYSPTHDGNKSTGIVRQNLSQSPSLVVTEHVPNSVKHPKNVVSPQDIQQNGRFSGSMSRSSQGSKTDGVPRPNTPENGLNIRDLEARLASVEQRNMILEAALLGVINASARSSLGGSRGNRSSGGSRNANSMVWEPPTLDAVFAGLREAGEE